MAELSEGAMSEMLHVICHRPGLIRGGRAHRAHAAYDVGVFSEAQLAELAGEPAITLVVGHTPDAAVLAAWSVAPQARGSEGGASGQIGHLTVAPAEKPAGEPAEKKARK